MVQLLPMDGQHIWPRLADDLPEPESDATSTRWPCGLSVAWRFAGLALTVALGLGLVIIGLLWLARLVL